MILYKLFLAGSEGINSNLNSVDKNDVCKNIFARARTSRSPRTCKRADDFDRSVYICKRCMQDTFARAARDDRVSCIQL